MSSPVRYAGHKHSVLCDTITVKRAELQQLSFQSLVVSARLHLLKTLRARVRADASACSHAAVACSRGSLPRPDR